MSRANTPPVEWDSTLFNELTPREQQFCLHPEVLSDPPKAARDVGYSVHTAKSKSWTMAKQLMYHIMPIQRRRMAEIDLSPDRVKAELQYIAFANEADFYDTVDVDGDTVKVLKDITRLPQEMQRAIKSVTYETIIDKDGQAYQRAVSVVLHDKIVALKYLGDTFGLANLRTPPPPPDGRDDVRALMMAMTDKERLLLEKLFFRAEQRLKDVVKDSTAIPGEVVRGKSDE